MHEKIPQPGNDYPVQKYAVPKRISENSQTGGWLSRQMGTRGCLIAIALISRAHYRFVLRQHAYLNSSSLIYSFWPEHFLN